MVCKADKDVPGTWEGSSYMARSLRVELFVNADTYICTFQLLAKSQVLASWKDFEKLL